MLTIFKRELKSGRKSLIFWCLLMYFMIWSGMTKYLGFEASGEAANKILEQFPESVQRILGFEGFDLTAPMGFYGVLYLYLMLLAAVQAVLLGVNLLAKEERDKTVEFLLTRPVSRARVVAEKFMAGLVSLAVLNLFTLAASLITLSGFDRWKGEYGQVLILMAGLFLLQFIFFTLGTVTGAVTAKPKKAASLAGSVMLMTFFIYLIKGFSERLEFLNILTPFSYFEAVKVINGPGYGLFEIGISFGVILTLSLATIYFYKRKDLTI